GVDRIIPIVSEHSIRTTVKKERVEAVALSATKQSLKSSLPEIEECVSVKEFLHRDFENTLKLIAHCEEGDKKSIRERLAEAASGASSKGRSVVVMIGPEGDFSENEIALALSKGYKPVTLGPSRLRVETAALAAVSEIYFTSID
ncbi:MAG: RNA methyltransferase, partial [Bacteroidales bacterium]|nr:RNA methyltransferase [Bacteroidales bacterium]